MSKVHEIQFIRSSRSESLLPKLLTTGGRLGTPTPGKPRVSENISMKASMSAENISMKAASSLATLGSRKSQESILGYGGFLPLYKYHVSGTRKKFQESILGSTSTREKAPETVVFSSCDSFKLNRKNMDRAQRYDEAIEQLESRGQSQEMLLLILKSKMSCNVNSLAQQTMKIRYV